MFECEYVHSVCVCRVLKLRIIFIMLAHYSCAFGYVLYIRPYELYIPRCKKKKKIFSYEFFWFHTGSEPHSVVVTYSC